MAETPQYKTLKSEEYKYGNNFIEIAKKNVEQAENPENAEFVSISKGYYTNTGEKRYKGGLGFPNNKEIKDFIAKSLQEL